LLTFTVVVTLQPVLAVYVIVLVPKDIAVTTPVFEILATAALLEVHALFAAAVPDPVSWEVVLGQSTVFPLMVGFGATVTVT
jgi:hypothetical protein